MFRIILILQFRLNLIGTSKCQFKYELIKVINEDFDEKMQKMINIKFSYQI
jgi:hypothetical protein